ncbi:MAG: VCBS repeat-containing protein [Bacteroidia bacterium]
MSISKILLMMVILTLLTACQDEVEKKENTSPTLFSLVSSDHTHVNFVNTVKETPDFHVLNYYYTYNGGGVAIGDINNDGLQDIFLTSNQQSNQLYLNKGDFTFEDITVKARVGDPTGWTTGVNMIDINNDGWLDIYVCKSASLQNPKLRQNLLFINQKDGTFRNEAGKWGLDDNGFSVQSYFFDYDKDGDLDMYLINHRVDFLNSVNLDFIVKDDEFFPETSDHLYRNDGTQFTDITIDAGLKNKEFSLSASIGDFNDDGWPDIYVANDFITPDKLYINQKNGTFTNEINERIKHTSYSSMGSDYADINNDLLPDLLVLDMSAEDHSRGKQNMPSMNTSGFWYIVEAGYHYTYMSNILNLNNGNGTFSDIAQVAGVSKTDWSWGASDCRF